jgi:hypothetical protein
LRPAIAITIGAGGNRLEKFIFQFVPVPTLQFTRAALNLSG